MEKTTDYLNSEFHYPSIILFGSLAKLEAKGDSDMDIAILTNIEKKISMEKLERKSGRKVQLFQFKSLSGANKELKNSIMNGFLIQGELR